jgi:hypothetical protein
MLSSSADGLRLQGIGTGLAGTNADGLLKVEYENLAVADLAGNG